jgi:SAM-dependent methyltransferase
MPELNDLHRRYIQQAGWTQHTRRFLLGLADELPENPRILEVGSGTGAVLGDLEVKSDRLHGLDIQHSSLVYSHKLPGKKAALCTGDGALLPYQNESFDLVYCHFLLLWVDSPALVLQEMTRVLKSEGFLMCFAEPDYGGRIDHPPVLEELGLLQIESLSQQGADPLVGRKLNALAGHLPELVLHRTGIIGQDIPRPTMVSDRYWDNEWEILESDLRETVSLKKIQQYKNAYQDAVLSGDQVLFIPTFYLAATKK